MKPLVTIATLSLVLSLPAVAGAAQNDMTRALRGSYAFSGDAACLHSPNGFSNFRANPAPNAPGRIQSFSVRGVRKFNGDGTGSVSGRSISFYHSPSPANSTNTNLGPYFTVDFSANFTYTVDSDGALHAEHGPLTSTQVEGPNVGSVNVWTGIKFDGYVSEDFKTITVATPSSLLETQYTNLVDAQNGVNATDYRYCHRSRTMIRISNGNHEDRERGNSRSPF